MKLKLTNETEYSTADLRRLVLGALRAEADFRPEWKWDLYVVRVTYARGGEIGGYGYYNRRHFQLTLPSRRQLQECFWPQPTEPVTELCRAQVKNLAQVAIHEIGHNQGLKHKDMVGSADIDVSWAEGMRIRLAEPKVKAKPTAEERSAKKEAHARAMLAMHEGKFQRERRLVSKWKKKVRYYDRKRAAATRG